MKTHDINGKEYARLSQLKVGDKVKIDTGFYCLFSEIEYEVFEDGAKNKFIRCTEGEHNLDSQLDYDDEGDHFNRHL